MPARKSKRLTKANNSHLLLLAFGLLLIIFSFYRYYSIRVLTFDYNPQEKEENHDRPTRIIIDKVGIDLGIEPAIIDNGIWEISDTSVSHLTSSASVGDGGNIVVYGHNKNHLLGPVRWLSPGDIIILKDEAGEEYIYVVEETETVDPDYIEPVLPKDEEILTLYTCTGLFDSKRFVVYAYPEN